MLGSSSVQSDVRYALRVMRRTPLFTVTIFLTVAIAIAANTTIFTVVNAVMIRPLPFREPNRIMQIAEKNEKLNLPNFASSMLNFLSWREQTKSFEELGAVRFATFTLTGGGEPEQLTGSRISPALTRVLGLGPVVGRVFTADEEQPGTPLVAMIGEGLLKRRFGGDRTIVGRTISLDGKPTMIVGIAPAALNLIARADVYIPLKIDPSKEIRLHHGIIVYGRLKPGVTPGEAQAEMDTIAVRLGNEYPEVRDWGIHLISMFDTFVDPELKRALFVLLVAVAFVLLIACATIANLLLARAVMRQKEMAVRAAMGATRAKLIRQLLTESVVLAMAGGGAGVLGAFVVVRVMSRTLPPDILPVPDVEVNATVLLFALGLTFVTGVLFGLIPAWRMASGGINEALKEAGRGSTGGIRGWLRDGLAAGELALATILLIGAGLLVQSLANLQHVRLGFDSRKLMTFELAPPMSKYPLNDKAPEFYHSLANALQTIPGVSGAAVVTGLPFGAMVDAAFGNYTSRPMITTEPSLLAPGTEVPLDHRIVSPGYFDTMRIPRLRGRNFTDGDARTAPPVVIVSQATAAKFWGDADPLGRTLRFSSEPNTAFTIVGVVGDVRNTALSQETPSLYHPLAQGGAWPLMDVAVRTPGRPEEMLPAIRQKVRELDPELALSNVKTMDEWLSINVAQPRLNTVLLTAFAGVALLIAVIGIYGVLAYSVNQRTREIGLRMALGATPQSVLRSIIGEGLKVVVVGMAIGLAGGLALGRAVSSLVFGVPVRDPLTFCVVALVLGSVALAACAIPARRASRVDPMVALRHE